MRLSALQPRIRGMIADAIQRARDIPATPRESIDARLTLLLEREVQPELDNNIGIWACVIQSAFKHSTSAWSNVSFLD
jgi:hypothetical protein